MSKFKVDPQVIEILRKRLEYIEQEYRNNRYMVYSSELNIRAMELAKAIEVLEGRAEVCELRKPQAG